LGGVLRAESFGKVSALALDPIEKKPLFHFYPGQKILSAGSYGCNLRCPFCQNHEIAQSDVDLMSARDLSPQELVNEALSLRSHGNIGLAFTYNEPFIWYEYVLETARLAREHNLKTVLVTNGMINEQPLLELLPWIDAINIDLKAFSDNFYHSLIRGDLSAVRHTIELCYGQCHVEVTTLVIPEMNDEPEEMEELSSWLASVGPDIPLHLTRFFPRYRMADARPTPHTALTRLAEIAERHLKHVHLGNI
jgi:pyruvate formate lyase activating enzyme